MKALKIIGIILAGLVVLIAIIAAFLSPKSHLERSIVINAPDSVVFKQINTLTTYQKWSPFYELYPDSKNTFEGPESGVGAKMSWVSEKAGNGSQWIIESMPSKHIKMGLQFEGTDGTYSADFNFEPAEGGTKVTWTYDGDVSGTGMGNAILGKYMGTFMDGFLGPIYEKGLNNLKTLSESAPQPQTQSTELAK